MVPNVNITTCSTRNSSVGMACRGHDEAETSHRKVFSVLFICCMFVFERTVMCEFLVLSKYLNFDPTSRRAEKKKGFPKRLFRRTRDSWYENNHNYFPSRNFSKLEQPLKQQKEGSLNSVDWPQGFYKEQNFFSNFSQSQWTCSSAGTSPAQPMLRTRFARNSPASSCMRLNCVAGQLYQHVAGVELHVSDRCEHARVLAKFLHCWWRHRGAVARVPTPSGMSQSRKFQNKFTFSDMLFTQHWRQTPKFPFSKN